MDMVSKKKKTSCWQHLISALRNKYRAVSAVIYAVVILLTTGAIPCFSAEDLNWTEEELAFMKEHPVILLGVDPEFVPFEFIDERGEYKGIAADYLALISEKTGLQFEIAKGLTWPEAYDKAVRREVDALPIISKTPEREEHFLFSEPYYYYKRVIVTRDTDTDIKGIDDLEKFTVAVQRNSSNHSYLLSYPHINLSLYETGEAALTAVSTGAEKAFVGNLATTNYIIRSYGLNNLRTIVFEPEKQQALHFAVRKDWPELVSIFDKAMASIPEREKLAINDKWIELNTDVDYGPVLHILYMAGAFIVVVLAVSIFWIIRLQKEVHHRKQIQLALETAKREAEEANEFKSNFMARMSHEIRTPLNAIAGMTYLLKRTELSLTQRMYIDRIIQATDSMLSIINDILDLSKIEAGKVELETTSFSLDQVIQEVVNIVSYKIDEQGIGFRLTKDPQVPNWFVGDRKKIEQVLVNVLNNAAKFTSTGEVSLDIRVIARETDTYHISFTVKDTGIGMTQVQITRLFEPFEQGDSSINRRFGGSGLGLSIVKSLVEMMGGEIQVFSTPGEGSTFVIRLPLTVDKEKEETYKRALVAEHLKGIKTLVLEKPGPDMDLIGGYLSSFGMQYELTSSETSALRLLEKGDDVSAEPFNLLIVAYDAPAEDGFQFIETIRSNKKIVKLPKIIMLLPMTREDLFDELNQHGIDMGIRKPIIPSVLFNGIMDLFNLNAIFTFQPAASDESALTRPEKNYRVLLVEDNETNQLIAKSLLEEAGIETLIASDGREAVEQYRKHKDSIDLVLMDLHMPTMNGYEAAEKIRQLSHDVPIVAMTADVVQGVRERCAQSGMYHYISKPFKPEGFLQDIIDILEAGQEESKTGYILDQQQGLENMGGNAELYRQVLREYYHENRDTLDKLAAAVRERKYADAAQIVHKIKGSSGSIGAKSLYDIAVAFQKALEEERENEIGPLQDIFAKLLKRLLEELKAVEETYGRWGSGEDLHAD